jgi:predicted nucleic acid-binding protein
VVEVAAYYFDTSGIVKRYIHETGSSWVQGLVDPVAGHRIFLARIAAVEVTSAVTRRRRGGSISASDAAAVLAQFRQDLAADYAIVEITSPLLGDAMSLAELHGLRAYDAVQLAAAIGLQALRTAGGMSDVTLVSSDHDLNLAATASGLLVEDPSLHP